MVHVGDITKLSGYSLPVVDCITGGSPCQDLSIAGARKGLAGERSGLFMEQVRIVKEMRDADRRNNGRAGRYVRPRFMVWENVPGAFSSNGGRDFQAVLTEIVKIAEESPDVPMPDRWPKSGCLYDEMGRWSVAWRVHDAQFWGVPQRRKRIAVVADFGGLAAAEVLFERKGLSWDSGESGAEEQGSARGSSTGTRSAMSFQERAGKPGGGKGILIQGEHVGALSTFNNQSVLSIEPIPIHDSATRYKGKHGDKSDGKGNGLGIGQAGDPANTLSSGDRHAVLWNGKADGASAVCSNESNRLHSMDVFHCTSEEEKAQTLKARDYKDPQVILAPTVRRLTPMECERLQGYPDGWTDIGDWADTNGKMHKTTDSARYKALGNSIALPFWFYILRRISAIYERPATLGSLFDGIGGFPLCWENCNGKGTALWASEIEEFCMAVTRRRFR